MSKKCIKTEDVLNWHGSEHNIEELAEYLAEIINGNISIETAHNDVMSCKEELAPFEDWNNSELASSLMENDEFIVENLEHLSDEEFENLKLYEWDRSDLIGYAYQYLNK